MQQEPRRAEDTALIKPAKVLTRLRAFLASFPNRDSRGSVELVQTGCGGAVHRRTQPAEIIRDSSRPGDGRWSPWILIRSALRYARGARQRDAEPSIPIRTLSHKLECQHSGTLVMSGKTRSFVLRQHTAGSALVTQIQSLHSTHPNIRHADSELWPICHNASAQAPRGSVLVGRVVALLPTPRCSSCQMTPWNASLES